MKNPIYLLLVVLLPITACKKNTEDENGKYIVSASKIIGLSGSDWQVTEPQLKKRPGYLFIEEPRPTMNAVKGTAYLPAIDERSRIDAGGVYLYVLNAGVVRVATYRTEPISQSATYSMMLEYYTETLQTAPTATYATGISIINGVIGSGVPDTVLAILRRGQASDELALTYKINGQYPSSNLDVSRQNDGRYVFTYSGD